MTSPSADRRSVPLFVATQFLGAFNDNAFKQMILLLAIDLGKRGQGEGLQGLAMALFSLPFILFSPVAGALADRYSKTRIIVVSKVAEIVIMGLGAAGFWSGSVPLLLVALFLMGAQSAFFAPAKYGVLPELVAPRGLPGVNGVVLMTTFLAIILGTAAAGWLKEEFSGRLWLPGVVYVALAVVGTITALGIARRPASRPDLRVALVGDLPATWRIVRADRDLVVVLLAHSFFWLTGSIIQPTINVYGRELMRLGDADTSYLLATLSMGMATGGVAGGMLSRGRIEFRLTIAGFAGVALAIGGLAVVHGALGAVHATLFALGLFGSLLGLPLQTFIQHRAPEGTKGRVVAMMNFLNWVFIFAGAGYYAIAERATGPQWIAVPLGAAALIYGLWLRRRLARIAGGL